MSFLSTYNSLSIRDWQQPSGTAFFTQANVLSNGSGSTNDTTYNGNYYVTCGGPASAGNIRIYIKNSNNSLTQQFSSNNIPTTDIKIAGTSGNWVVAGDGGYDSNTFTNNGILRFYNRSNTTWSLTQNIFGNVSNLRLGNGVAIDENGTRCLVITNNTANTLQGKIRIYNYTTSWGYVSETTLSNFSYSGTVIDCAANANFYVVGSQTECSVNINDNGTWSNFLGSANTDLGYTVYMNTYGNIVIAGAPTTNNGANTNTGKVHIYKKSGNTWSETANIVAPTVGNIVDFGVAAVMNDDATILAISGSSDFSKHNIYIYTGDTTSYALSQIVVAPNLTQFGYNLTMSTNAVYLYTNGGGPPDYQYLYVS